MSYSIKVQDTREFGFDEVFNKFSHKKTVKPLNRRLKGKEV